VRKIVAGPFPGIAIMVGGLIWNSISNGLTPQTLFVLGAFYAIAALFVRNWNLEKARQPHLRLVFDQDLGSPFVREKPLYDDQGNRLEAFLRIFSVGLTNSGNFVDNVSVKLMRIEPEEFPERFGLSLRVMDQELTGSTATASVPTSHNGKPIVFFELLTQRIPSTDAPPNWVAIRFAEPTLFDRVRLSGKDRYFLQLAISGDGAEPERRLILQTNNRHQYEMREHPF
jgi:hypothetical protein